MKTDCHELRQRVEELELYKTMLDTRELERQEMDGKRYVTEIRLDGYLH